MLFVLYIDVFFARFFSSFQGVHVSHSLRDLDRGEGAALHAHLFEETVDWMELISKQIMFLCKGNGR